MEETASVFWVDLGYRLRSRKRVSLQGSRGMIDTLVLFLFLFLIYMLYMLPDYLAVETGSASGVWVVVSGMHGTHLKHIQYLQSISFNNLGSRLARVIGIV